MNAERENADVSAPSKKGSVHMRQAHSFFPWKVAPDRGEIKVSLHVDAEVVGKQLPSMTDSEINFGKVPP